MPNTDPSKLFDEAGRANLRRADMTAIDEAATLLRSGALVAFPTETVYGLGADATNGEAVARIFDTKGRPHFNPLIVHVPDIAAAQKIAQMSTMALKLASSFWPGPLTLVMPRSEEFVSETDPISDLVSSGLPTLAIRIPDHPITQALLKATGRPLAAPSANRSGHVSATRAEHVASDLGNRVGMILDGGPTAYGLESTILAVTKDDIVLLRPGAVPIETLEAIAGRTISKAKLKSGEVPTSSGQLASHYATRAQLRLNASSTNAGEALLSFGPQPPDCSGPTINLSPSGNMIEAASGLFAALRSLDATGVVTIAVMTIPDTGLGAAINDRLQRAAAPR